MTDADPWTPEADWSNAVVELGRLAPVDPEQFDALDRRWLVLRSSFVVAAMVIVVGLGILLISVLPSAGVGFGLIGIGIIGGIALIGGIAAAFGSWGYLVRDHDLSVRKGIIHRQHITVPYNRVQHATVSSGPFDRALGLASLNVFTAGGVGAEIRIDGLNQHRARQLQRLVLTNVAKTARTAGDEGLMGAE